MTTTQQPASVAAPTPPRRRRAVRWLVAALVLVALLALTGWQLVGRRPHLDSGYSWGADAAAVDEVGSVTGLDTGSTWWVDRSDGTYWSLVRNDGRAPVTLHRDGIGDISALAHQQVSFATVVRPYDKFGTPTATITLAPGEEARVTVHLLLCGTPSPGSTGVMVPVEGLDLDATTWGLTRKVHLDMGASYGFYSKTGAALPRLSACSVGID